MIDTIYIGANQRIGYIGKCLYRDEIPLVECKQLNQLNQIEIILADDE